MRRVLGIICYVLSMAANGAAGYFSYQAYDLSISYEKGLLIFVPLFIVSYWFSTFYGQLIAPKGRDLLIPKWLNNVLYWLSTLVSVALIAFWGYMVYDKKLYLAL
ncbi:MAG: hypothetical protein IJ561_05315 [Ruminococcus sp.]|nr:hypothetical protein [Ruminococcus sp.]